MREGRADIYRNQTQRINSYLWTYSSMRYDLGYRWLDTDRKYIRHFWYKYFFYRADKILLGNVGKATANTVSHC